MGSQKNIDTSILDKALIFATQAHSGISRKGNLLPYIVHPIEVVSIVASITEDQELLAAAALHDTVEDCGVLIETLRKEFGDRVADIVDCESDKLAPGETMEGTWKKRKEAAINHLRDATMDVKIVALGDKLANMRAIYRDYSNLGSSFWGRFHESDPKLHEWHYRGLADSLKELKDTYAYQEFVYLIDQVFCK